MGVIKRLCLIFLFFLACSQPSDFSHIKVVEVIDGDTVKLQGGRLLCYIGIDTPEIRMKENGRWIYKPKPFALESKNFNRQLVEGKHVRVEFDLEKTDKYGRLLGYVFLEDDTFVNARLLKGGYAVLYTYPPNVKYADLFIARQREARESKKGLWGAYSTVSQNKAHEFIGQIRTVRGKVLDTYRSKKCIFLNFGRNYKTDFTVVIFKNSWEYFEDKGIDPLTFYKGRIVEVTGRIKEYNGPEIIVNIPREIRVIRD
ncbi:MAG: thermonuclease family protein [Candidatus Omnitrophica bacterium]|nr:thermonuclease family protein [Candidatus Omnitrophota bacterium]